MNPSPLIEVPHSTSLRIYLGNQMNVRRTAVGAVALLNSCNSLDS